MGDPSSKKSARTKGDKQRPPSNDELDRDRRGKEPFTNAQVLARWQRIRDGAMCLTEKLIAESDSDVPKFLSSIVDTVKSAQAEITGLERMLGIGDAAKVKGFDWAPSLPDEEPGVEA